MEMGLEMKKGSMRAALEGGWLLELFPNLALEWARDQVRGIATYRKNTQSLSYMDKEQADHRKQQVLSCQHVRLYKMT